MPPGSLSLTPLADTTLADFAATEGKEVIALDPAEAEKFNAASAPIVEQVIDQAEASGIQARAYVEALRGE